jgi:hypothetical protein
LLRPGSSSKSARFRLRRFRPTRCRRQSLVEGRGCAVVSGGPVGCTRRCSLYCFFTNSGILKALFTWLEPGRAFVDCSWILSDFVMSKMNAADIRIDHVHSRAICDEIGERLGQTLRRESVELPPRLQLLVARLAALDGEIAPSIVPACDDMLPQRKLHASSARYPKADLTAAASSR